MTIKKNFLILASIIVAIPLLCTIVVYLQYYFRSNQRMLMNGTKKMFYFDSKSLSREDQKEFFKNIRLLPPDVQVTAITEDDKVIFTSMPEIEINNDITNKELWSFVNQTTNKYFYQFTIIDLTDSKLSLITRTPRKKHNPKKRMDLLPLITLLVFVIVLICIFLIFLISKTIFKSIKIIEKSTQEIADGNLDFNIKDLKSNIKENEITSTLDSLEKMRCSLLEEQNRKNNFVMGISHDLRTPVAIIKGYIEAISDGVITEPEEIRTTMELIQSKTTQLSEMIDSLISFTKMNSIEIRNTLIPGSITDTIKSFAKEVEVTTVLFKRQTKTNINLPENIIIPFNEQLVRRSLENLFSNAVRYTKENDLIEVNSYIKDHKIYLEINDTGIGIAEEDLKYIFDIFYRVSNSRHEEGMGIGLSVVKNIIDTHNWKIDVHSELGKGTNFTITIPY